MQVALARTGVRQNPLAELTPRELQALSLLAQGKPYGRIADELGVSYKTVVNACSQLKRKLNGAVASERSGLTGLRGAVLRWLGEVLGPAAARDVDEEKPCS